MLSRCRVVASVRIGLLLALAVGLDMGCRRSENDFRPGVSDAQAALGAALDAWKAEAKPGAPIQPADGAGRVIQLFDSDFTAGKKLASWKIDSSDVPAEGPCSFSVTLEFQGAPQAVTAKFYVTGIAQHYSIFRDRDYEQRAGQM